MPNSTMTELDRIKADEELVAQINEFRGKGKVFLKFLIKAQVHITALKKGISILSQILNTSLPEF